MDLGIPIPKIGSLLQACRIAFVSSSSKQSSEHISIQRYVLDPHKLMQALQLELQLAFLLWEYSQAKQ